MRLVVVIIGVLLGVYGAVHMLTGHGGTDEHALRRAKWRSRWGTVLIAIGVVLVVFGALVLPLSNRILMTTGPGGVLLLIFLNVVALALDAIALVFLFFNGVPLASPDDLNEPWLVRARHRTRYGIAILFGAFLAQLGGVALILF